MVGVSTYARDFRGKRARANAFLRVRPNIGANDGVLQLVVNTRNGCGIAAGSDILCDFGEHYMPTSVPSSMLAGGKRFRGALDVIVRRQLESREAITLTGIGAIDGVGIEGASVPQVATAAAKADVIAAAAATTAAAAAAATAEAAAGSGAPGGRPGAGSTAPLEGEVLVVENDQHTIVVDKSQRIVIRSKAAKNTKVAPKTVLRLVTATGFDECRCVLESCDSMCSEYSILLLLCSFVFDPPWNRLWFVSKRCCHAGNLGVGGVLGVVRGWSG